jgi:hypothetical protein
MSKTVNTYKLSSIKISADLNQDSTNFSLSFVVKSLDDKEFFVTVVNQTDLDNNGKLQFYESTDGVIEGTLNEQNNLFQNHYLVMKANKPCDVEVTIIKEDLPFVEEEEHQEEQQEQQQQQQHQQDFDDLHEKFNESNPVLTFFKKDNNMRNSVIVVIIGVCIYFVLNKLENVNGVMDITKDAVSDSVSNSVSNAVKSMSRSPLRSNFLNAINSIN